MPQSDPEVARTLDVGDPERWEKGEIRRAKDVSATLSFRVSGRLAVDIESFADAHQISVSDVLRRSVERYIEGPVVATYSNTYFSIVGTTWNASLHTGGPTTLSASGTTSGGSATLPPQSPTPLLEYGAQVSQP